MQELTIAIVSLLYQGKTTLKYYFASKHLSYEAVIMQFWPNSYCTH